MIVLDSGVRLEVLGPRDRLLRGTSSDVNDASVILRLAYGEVSFLLTGDASQEAESDLVARKAPIDSDVLKVAHHGSRTSSSPDFIRQVSPTAALISAGAENRFGHPHPESLATLSERVSGDAVFVTKDHGTVEFVTDGRRLEVITER